MRASTLVLMVCLAFAGCAVAPPPNSESARSFGELNLAALDVLIIPDSSQGVRILLIPAMRTRDGTALPPFDADFDPARVTTWLNAADAVARAPARVKDSAARTLQTPGLVARDSSILLLRRDRNGSQWTTLTTLVFLGPRGGQGLRIGLWPAEVRQLISELFRAQAESRVDTMIAAPVSAGVVPEAELGEPPAPILGSVHVGYPESARLMRQPGRVRLSFVVDTVGRVEPASVRVISATDLIFAPNAIHAVLNEQFRPGRMKDGQAVRVLVTQQLDFKFNMRS
ncbi:MAG: energy transducer TonB [Gemmatimonadales bacterium]